MSVGTATRSARQEAARFAGPASGTATALARKPDHEAWHIELEAKPRVQAAAQLRDGVQRSGIVVPLASRTLYRIAPRLRAIDALMTSRGLGAGRSDHRLVSDIADNLLPL